MRWLAAGLVVLIASGAAHADVTVESRQLQKGLFLKGDCKAAASAVYNECECQADLSYPVISGMSDSKAQAAINTSFEQKAAQMQCKGAEIAAEKKTVAASSAYQCTQTFASATVIAFKCIASQFSGGAHGDQLLEGDIIDLRQGKILLANDIFSGKNISAINQDIYEALAALPEGDVSHSQIESHQKNFIDARTGECHGCTLVLMKDGVHALFQLYDVAPYAAGNMDVLISNRYIDNQAIKTALTEKE